MFTIVWLVQLHGHVEERIDELKFEEAALQRRHRMVNGLVAKQPATSEDSLNKLQAERRSLGECILQSDWSVVTMTLH